METSTRDGSEPTPPRLGRARRRGASVGRTSHRSRSHRSRRRPGALRGGLALLASLALLATFPTAAHPQEEAPPDSIDDLLEPDDPFGPAATAPGSRPGFLFDVGGGFLAPLADLSPSSGDPLQGTLDPLPQLSSSPAVSGGLTYLFSSRVGVGVRATWAPSDVDDQVPTGGDRSLEGELGEANFVAASVEAVLQPLPRPVGGVLTPYVALGGGIRHLSFDFEDPRLDDETDPMGTVAGGIRTELPSRLHWWVELRDYISKFKPAGAGSKFQNDFAITAGFGVGL